LGIFKNLFKKPKAQIIALNIQKTELPKEAVITVALDNWGDDITCLTVVSHEPVLPCRRKVVKTVFGDEARELYLKITEIHS